MLEWRMQLHYTWKSEFDSCSQVLRDVLKHSSAGLNQVKICKDGLRKKSARPSDEKNFPPAIQDW